MIEIKKVVEKQKIQDKKKKAAKSEKEAKKLVSLRFYKQIYIFRKKTSKRMPIKRVWDYVIEVKKSLYQKREIYICCQEKKNI